MSAPHAAVLVFPGSNCDHDADYALGTVLGARSTLVWHKDGSLPGDTDLVVVPGGFSYGDYLRTGALARFSPIMRDVVRFASAGGSVIGICNGFQILLEAGLLPGAMLRNESLKFVCRWTNLRVETAETRFTSACTAGEVLKIPVAHGEGNYTADPATLDELEANGQIVFRYVDASGEPTAEANPNGSQRNIAGIINRTGNVLGLMPHPERACEAILGSTDGAKIFRSVLSTRSVPV